MGKETLLSAARRVYRDMNIDMKHGGLVQESTEIALLTLGREVERAGGHEKRARDIAARGDGEAALALVRDVFDVEDPG